MRSETCQTQKPLMKEISTYRSVFKRLILLLLLNTFILALSNVTAINTTGDANTN